MPADFDMDYRDWQGYPVHLLNAKLYRVPNETRDVDGIFTLTGRIVLRRSLFEGTGQLPMSLATAKGPAVVGSFQWTSNPSAGPINVDITEYLDPFLRGPLMPYLAWRIRSLTNGVTDGLAGGSTFAATGTGFIAGTGGFGIAINNTGSNNQIQKVGTRYIFNGGGQEAPYLRTYNVEVGYGAINARNRELTGGSDWPAWTGTIAAG